VEEILLFNKIFPILDNALIANIGPSTRRSCDDGAQRANFWQFLRRVFSARRVQHISDLRPKFAIRPHHVWKYGSHPIWDG